MKKARQIFALLCLISLVFSLAIPAVALENQGKVVDLGDGFYMVVTVDQYTTYRDGDTVYRSKTGDCYHLGTKIGTATLIAVFDISGPTAVAKSATLTGSGMNGWTFQNDGAKCSGNMAIGNAKFTSGSTQKSFTLTLTCSPDGTVS